MDMISIPRSKLVRIISDVESLVSHFEDLDVKDDDIVKRRLRDVKGGRIEGRSEAELDSYLKRRGVKVE